MGAMIATETQGSSGTLFVWRSGVERPGRQVTPFRNCSQPDQGSPDAELNGRLSQNGAVAFMNLGKKFQEGLRFPE